MSVRVWIVETIMIAMLLIEDNSQGYVAFRSDKNVGCFHCLNCTFHFFFCFHFSNPDICHCRPFLEQLLCLPFSLHMWMSRFFHKKFRIWQDFFLSDFFAPDALFPTEHPLISLWNDWSCKKMSAQFICLKKLFLTFAWKLKLGRWFGDLNSLEFIGFKHLWGFFLQGENAHSGPQWSGISWVGFMVAFQSRPLFLLKALAPEA